MGGFGASLGGGVWAAKQTTTTAKATAIDQSLRLRLHSGLRQSGGRFAAVLDAGLKPRSTSEATAKAVASLGRNDMSWGGMGTTGFGGWTKEGGRAAHDTPPYAKDAKDGAPGTRVATLRMTT